MIAQLLRKVNLSPTELAELKNAFEETIRQRNQAQKECVDYQNDKTQLLRARELEAEVLRLKSKLSYIQLELNK
jgi:predicted metal-binding transcription factor (methanogenesis marker protein 9)